MKRLLCVFGVLLFSLLVFGRPLEGKDNPSDGENLPEDSRVFRPADNVLAVKPPRCCKPEVYLSFGDKTVDKQEVHERISQFPGKSSGPCGSYVNLNAEQVQFKSATFAAVTDAITIAVWVKLQSTYGIHPILALVDEAGELRFELFEGYLNWAYTAVRPSRATFKLISETPVVSGNIWTHLLVQYDSYSRRCAVFLNGEKILNGFSNGGLMEIAWGDLTTLGEYSVNELIALQFNGFMDEFYIYFCSISETHIPSLAQGCDVKEKCLFPAPGSYNHDACLCKCTQSTLLCYSTEMGL